MDNQKRTENAIDRAEAMTKMLAENVKSDEEDIYIKVSAVVQLLRELSSVNPQPCEDAISRQAVLDIVDSYSESRSNVEDVTQDMISDILALPPVTPQPKVGHWIFVDRAHEHAHCSECDYGNVDLLDGRPHNYCPNCGAKMVEPQESEG